jgi:hypothetical protein
MFIVLSSEARLSVHSQWCENFAFEMSNETTRSMIFMCLHAPFLLQDQGRLYLT